MSLSLDLMLWPIFSSFIQYSKGTDNKGKMTCAYSHVILPFVILILHLRKEPVGVKMTIITCYLPKQYTFGQLCVALAD